MKDFFERSWTQIQAYLGDLPATTKWLIGALLVILLLVGFLFTLWAGSPELVPITAFAADRQGEVVARLKNAGIAVQTQGGQVLVPAEKHLDALVTLQQGDLMSGDTTAAFEDLVRRQSPWQSNADKAQAYLLAKQKVLGQMIGKMRGVRAAGVMISMPEDKGFGKTHVRPSAAVNIVMQANREVDQSLVDAVAGLVSGAVAGMQPADVTVIDANHGRQHTVKSGDDMIPSQTLALEHRLEAYHREKIAALLRYIPGVIVAVNVRTDPVIRRDTERWQYDRTEPLQSTEEQETERINRNEAGEGGVRPNVGLSIEGGGGTTSSERTVKSRADYREKPILERSTSKEAGQRAQQINVTINVPRNYFMALARQRDPDAKDLDDAALQSIVTQQLAQIQSQVEPLISTAEGASVVRAHMIPDVAPLFGAPGGEGGPGGMLVLLDSRWAKPAALAALAALSLAMMFGMVRKATQRPELPSVQELAGIPPPLPTEDDLVGQAEEVDAGLMGVELGESEIRSRKVAEQISEMVKTNPAEAAGLFSRWIRKET